MLRNSRLAVLPLALIAGLSAAQANAAEPAPDISEMERQIELLQSQIQELKRAQAAAFAETRRRQDEQVTVKLNNGRPSLATPDGNFTASLRATVQLDSALYAQESDSALSTFPAAGGDLSDGTNFRRAQIGVEGTVFKDWAYSFIYDFGGSGTEGAGRISNAYIQYNGIEGWQFRVGAFAPSIGLEDSTSSADTLFGERASPSELSRSLTGGDGRMAVQATATGETWLASLSLSGSSAAASASFDEQLALNGRAAWLFHSTASTKAVASVSGVYLFDPAETAAGPGGTSNISLSDRPELRVDGTQLINTGSINASSVTIFGGELGATHDNLSFQAGYFGYDVSRRASAIEDPSFDGWYAQAGWVLTGETRAYDPARAAFRAPRPDNPLDFGETPGSGAFELAARYSQTNLNFNELLAPAAGRVRGGDQQIFSLGLNWYPNQALRALLAWQHVDIDRLSPGGTGLPVAGTDLSQSYNQFSLRLQFTL